MCKGMYHPQAWNSETVSKEQVGRGVEGNGETPEGDGGPGSAPALNDLIPVPGLPCAELGKQFEDT